MYFLFVAVMAMGAATASEAAADFTAPTGEFRIALPSPPTVEIRDQDVVYKAADGDTTYLIRRMVCPAKYAADATPEAYFEAFQADSVRLLVGTLESHRTFKAPGARVPGREFVVHALSKKSGRPYEMITQLFRIGPNIFMITATLPREDQARARAIKVLETLAFLK